MSKSNDEGPPDWVSVNAIDRVTLQYLAFRLEQKLAQFSLVSSDVAAFSRYPPILSAINRAKKMLIIEPEEIPGMNYWNFNTELGDPKLDDLGNALALFRNALRGWHRK